MKELLIFLISLGISMSQFLASMPDKSNPDWFCFGADAWHTCFVPSSAGPKTTDLVKRWVAQGKTSCKPTIIGNMAYLGYCNGIKCIDTRNGSIIWDRPTKGACCRQILYKDGKLYVNS